MSADTTSSSTSSSFVNITLAFDTWRVAEDPAVRVARLEWSELRQLSAAVADLRSVAESSSAVVRFRSRAIAARRVLTCTPLPPEHPLVDLDGLREEVGSYLDDHPGSVAWTELSQLRDASARLRSALSPLSKWTGDVLSCFGQDSDGRPQALLVCPRRPWSAAVYAWLISEGLSCVDVVTPVQARDGRPYAVVLLFGHPAYVYASGWKEPDIAFREYGWLLTAPPAPAVHMVLTSDQPVVDATRAWLLPVDAQPVLGVTDPGPGQHVQAFEPATVPVTLPGTAPPPAVDDHDSGHGAGYVHSLDTVDSTAFTLASGRSVYLHNQIGPAAQVLAVDDETEAVTLARRRAGSVRAGRLLALRVGVAEREEIIERADSWLVQRRGWTARDIVHVRDAVRELKQAMRQARQRQGTDQLVRHLVDRGLREDYARPLIRNVLDELYLAPQRQFSFDALLDELGLAHLHPVYQGLTDVRAAHQQAGEEIRRELIVRLADRSWVDPVEEYGWAVVRANGLGLLLLEVVTGVAPQQRPVPRTWLGAVLDTHGRRVTPASLIGGMP